MKKEKVSVSSKKKESKLNINDIKKSSDIEVSHTISKIKSNERQVIFAMALVFLCILGIVVCFVFTAASVEKIEGEKTGPLYVKFSENKDGMSDIVNFTEEDGDPSGDGAVIYSTEFTVSNYKGLNSWYAVYLDDYQDMIDYHKCEDIKMSEDDIYFSIDNSEPISLSSVNYGGRYVITEGIVDSNHKVTHSVKIWHMGYSEKHFHGKITVKFLR
ncbi:MAG: hypothetical protein IJE53_02435 [Bacilli bacterium]|nr:hypothetical protein [Bacilli bacterium]